MIFGIILFILFIILYNLYFLQYKKYVGNMKRLTNIPIIGDLFIFLKSGSVDKSLNSLFLKATEVQETCVLWFGPKMVIGILNPEDVKTVLTSPDCSEKSSAYYDVFNSLGLSVGLIYSKLSIWKPHRRLLNSSLNIFRVTSLIKNMNKTADDFIIRLENFINKEPFNVLPVMMDAATNHTLMVHFNKTYSRQNISIIAHKIESILKHIWRKLVEYVVFYPYYYLKQKLSIDLERNGILKTICTEIMQKEYKLFITKNNNDDAEEEEQINSVEDIRKLPHNFIARVVHMHHYKSLTMDESIDHLILLLEAGTDTTAVAISNILLLMAMHEDIQDNLYNEIKTILDDGMDIENGLSLENLNQFRYVDRVIKESLRFFPPGHLIARKSLKDIPLETGIIPSGTDILIPIYSIHRNKKYWGPDADKFNPDNFLPENVEKRHRCNYIPFSYGNRNCIAYQYAQISLKLLVIKILNKYKLTTELKLDELKFKYQITTVVTPGYFMKIEER